jgi:hypothetical protein
MKSARFLAAWLALMGCAAQGQGAHAQAVRVVPVTVNAGKVLHRISPEIYGVSFATSEILRDLNLPLNRSGGNSATLYDWRTDARNAGSDFYFESLPVTPDIFDQFHHGFVSLTQAAGARPILTIPAIGWTAKLGENRQKLAGFSVRKYGAQQDADTRWFPDAGNGKHPDGTLITVNDPEDAARPVDIAHEANARVSDIVARWGPSRGANLRYYAIDNEPGLWHESHREVRKSGVHAEGLAQRTIAVAHAIRQADPGGKIIAPEAWGWPELFDSGFDVEGRALGRSPTESDRALETSGMDQLPWLLERWRAAGHPVDVVSVHFYPQGGEFNDGSAGSRDIQLRRNRSTRALWDARYRDESWINAEIGLIPRLRGWVDAHYAVGTPIAITEYNWGGENSMSGATAQADIWGIFGRHRLDMAVRWVAPKPDTPTYKVMRLIRNADGKGGGFGQAALAVDTPDPDTLSAFAARRDDGALTVLVINKSLDTSADLRLRLDGARAASATVYRLDAGELAAPAKVAVRGSRLVDRLPVQSVALYVIPANGR